MDSERIVLTADSTCDLSEELISRFGVRTVPYHIVYEHREFLDGVDIQSSDILSTYKENGSIPKTACISAGEYMEFFRQFTEQGCQVVHLNLSSQISTSYQNAKIAAEELGGVYPVDSRNLSTGTALLVIEAYDLISAGKLTASEIADELSAITDKAHSSFILDNLDFLKAGGRCSSIVALGANLLKLKPCIEMNDQGAMSVTRKYRGDLEKVLPEYTRDMLEKLPDYRREKVFITHTDCDPQKVAAVRAILEQAGFEEIWETHAGCTITCHCGPGCLGVLFMTR